MARSLPKRIAGGALLVLGIALVGTIAVADIVTAIRTGDAGDEFDVGNPVTFVLGVAGVVLALAGWVLLTGRSTGTD